MRRVAWIAALAAVLIIALLLWDLAGTKRGSPGVPLVLTNAASESEGVAAQELHSEDFGSRELAGDARSAAPPADPEPLAQSLPPQRFVVEFLIRGLDGLRGRPVVTAQLREGASGATSSRTLTLQRGEVEGEVDLSDWIDAILTGNAAVDFHATDSELSTKEVTLDRSSVVRSPGGYEGFVTLVVEQGVLVGQVRSSSLGGPVRDAEVFLCSPGTRSLEPQQLAFTRTDSTGRFSLSKRGRTGDVRLVVCDGVHAVSSVLVTIADPSSVDELDPIDLSMGECLAGVAATLAPGERLAISARTGQPVVFGRAFLSWLYPDLSYSHRVATVDAHGRFEVCGLKKGVYAILVAGPEGACAFPGLMGLSVDATAPAEDLYLTLSRSVIRLVARLEGRPQARVPVTVTIEGTALTCYTAKDGSASFLVPPDVDYEARVAAPGIKPGSFHGRTPLSGPSEQVLALQRGGVGTVRIELVGEHVASIEALDVVFLDAESRAPALRAAASPTNNGEFSVSEVPPGQYELLIRDLPMDRNETTYFVEAHVSADVYVDRTTRVVAELELGGRLELRIEDADQALVPVECTLTDLQGNRVPVTFRTTNSEANTVSESETIPHQDTTVDGFARVRQALPGGEYFARTGNAEWKDRDVSFELKPGELTRLIIQLDPREGR